MLHHSPEVDAELYDEGHPQEGSLDRTVSLIRPTDGSAAVDADALDGPSSHRRHVSAHGTTTGLGVSERRSENFKI